MVISKIRNSNSKSNDDRRNRQLAGKISVFTNAWW